MLRASIGGTRCAAWLAAACAAASATRRLEIPPTGPASGPAPIPATPRYDQTKPIRKQEAPLKPEYQAMFEASIKDQDLGGHGLDPAYSCLPQGMPRMMLGVYRRSNS